MNVTVGIKKRNTQVKIRGIEGNMKLVKAQYFITSQTLKIIFYINFLWNGHDYIFIGR